MNAMVRVAVKDLHGDALNWAVAKCEGTENDYLNRRKAYPSMTGGPSNAWEQGGPIIEAKGIELTRSSPSTWEAVIDLDEGDALVEIQHGPTALVAAMRCVVASELGTEIEVPKEFAKNIVSVIQNKVRPQFEVRFETAGFTNNKSILGASFTEIEALSFSETCAKEGSFPLGVLGVVGGYITADDGQGESDIHVFASVTLLIEAESAQQIEKMKVPEGLLVRIADLMGADSLGNCVLDLEAHSWEVMDVEEMQSKDRLAALAEAKQVASEKDVFECVSTSPVDRDCSGKVMHANDHYTVISLGRNALVCPNEVLSSVPAKGAEVTILFRGGVGEVAVKGKAQAAGVER